MKTKLQVTIVLFLLLSPFLSACGSGQIFSPTPAPTLTKTPMSTKTPIPTKTPMPTSSPISAYRPVILDCDEWARIDNGDYQAQNNPWGKGNGSGWSQCIGLGNDTDGTLMGRWTWDLPYSNTVVAYPMILFGKKPPAPTTTDILPIKILDIASATVSYDISSTYTGRGNVALEFWLTDRQNPTTWAVPPITHEIMIWLDAYGGMNPAGRLIEQVSIDGTSYKVYVADNFVLGWRYIAFDSETSQLGAGRLNLVSFLSYLRENDLVTGEEYLAEIEIGNEIAYGVGETIVHKYEVSIQPK